MSASPRAGQIGTLFGCPLLFPQVLRVQWASAASQMGRGASIVAAGRPVDHETPPFIKRRALLWPFSHRRGRASNAFSCTRQQTAKQAIQCSQDPVVGGGLSQTRLFQTRTTTYPPPTHFTWPQLHSLAWGTGYTCHWAKAVVAVAVVG